MHRHRRRAGRVGRVLKKVALVGTPNVGKSVIFNQLTGMYATVSNYPGTTVEVARGKAKLPGLEVEVIDTPGMYTLNPLTEDERVARTILLEEKPDLIVHVVDAKNLGRTLPLTLQLLETGVPVVLDLNLIDEAERLGVGIDHEALSRRLGIPVVATAATTGRGIPYLKGAMRMGLLEGRRRDRYLPSYPRLIEEAVEALASTLRGRYPTSRRTVSLLLLQGDFEVHHLVEKREGRNIEGIKRILGALEKGGGRPPNLTIHLSLQREVEKLLEGVLTSLPSEAGGFREVLSRLMMRPITGVPLLLFTLFVGLYLFVGVVGAGVMVDYLESVVFEEYLNPWVTGAVTRLIPSEALVDLVAGEYGLFTLGVRYSVAIILPIVGAFFTVFSVIEDSGYLPRIALLIDRVFKRIGLNGRAVIPLTLGLGCDTMATIVTRTLETRRERVIATLLLALAIPCSAQLGVIFAILAGSPGGLLVWILVVLTLFLLVGYLAAQVLPGGSPSFYMEIPPLRVPRLSNVVMKTYTRMEWYFLEVFPIFLLVSFLIWVGRLTGVFDLALTLLGYPVTAIGLPPEATAIFLFGFFRRDYGAAGLYDLKAAGLLSEPSIVVSAVTLTLFIPCIAQLIVSLRERGVKATLAMVAFIFPLAFTVGFLLNLAFTSLGVSL